MKNKTFLIGFLTLSMVFLFIGCASQPAVPERFYVEPDPNNPQQGNFFLYNQNRMNERFFITVVGNTLTTYSYGNLTYNETNKYFLDSVTTEWKFSDDFQFVYRMDGSRIRSTYKRHDVKFVRQ